jgi:hypothetical protein
MAGEAWTMLETDLAATLESDFAAPVSLISPDGVVINTSANGGALLGKVQYDYKEQKPTGEIIVVKELLVILRKSSLARIPKAGEKWFVTVPTSPSDPTPRQFIMDGSTRAPTDGGTIGFIRLFPQAVKQS